MIQRIFSAFVLFLWVSCSTAFAVLPDEILTDPILEQRARVISKDLRCLVCQNQSIDDSNAPLAKDLRVIVRERLKAGDSDAQIFEFVVARYGNYVLLQPPLQSDTLLLWATPFLVLALSLTMVVAYLRKSQHEADETEVSDG